MTKHRIGDILEFSAWITGEETREQIEELADEVDRCMSQVMADDGVMLKKIGVTTLDVGDPRLPDPPDHIQGVNVQCMIVEARVLLDLPTPSQSRFADELEKDDFNRLAKITRDDYARQFPGSPPLTHDQCKTVINDIGPDAAYDVLRGFVHDTTRYIQ